MNAPNRYLLLFRLCSLALAFIPTLMPGQSPSSAPAAGTGALPIKTGQQIVFLGDSTTQSAWMSASGFIHLVTLGLAKENVQIKASQYGNQGDRPQELWGLYQKNVATMSPKADWLVVSCGLDEVIRGLPQSDPATFQQKMKSLVDGAKADGLQVMILTTSVANERGDGTDQKLAPYNDALRALAKSENCLLVDVNAAEKTALPTLPPSQGGQRLLLGEPPLNTHGERLVASEILKTLGVTATQLAEIQESWLDAPGSATALAPLNRLKGTVLITLREYNGIETLAQKEHKSLSSLVDALYGSDVVEALRAADASSEGTAIQTAAQAFFARDVADILKKLPPPAPTATASVAAPPSPAASATTAATAGGVLVKSGQKVAFMGDSITQFGWQHAYGYVHLVIRGLATVGVQAEAVPAGVSGNTSRDMLARLQKSVLDPKPDWMTLSCGVNDVWHGLTGCDLDTYKKNITSIVDQAQHANIQVVLLTATMIMETDNANNQKLAAYNDFLRSFALERKLPLADLNEAERATLKAIPADAPYHHLTVDGVHMNPHGDQMMALGVLKAFGLTDAQLAQVKEHWLDEPSGGSVDGNAIYSGSVGITLRESDALEQLAVANKKLVTDYLAPLYLQALIEQAKSDATQTDLGRLQTAAQALFRQKVTDLAKNASAAPAPPASAM